MADFYFVHDTNPNDAIGGGGCLASGARASEDCSGKWIQFHRVSTEHDASPYAVICEHHLAEVANGYEFEDVLSGGDRLPVRDQRREPIEADLAPVEPTPHVVIR